MWLVSLAYMFFSCELSPRSESIKNRCYAHYRLCRLHPLAGKSYQHPMVLIQIQAGLNGRAKQR